MKKTINTTVLFIRLLLHDFFSYIRHENNLNVKAWDRNGEDIVDALDHVKDLDDFKNIFSILIRLGDIKRREPSFRKMLPLEFLSILRQPS
jgi:hypothetical protein